MLDKLPVKGEGIGRDRGVDIDPCCVACIPGLAIALQE